MCIVSHFFILSIYNVLSICSFFVSLHTNKTNKSMLFKDVIVEQPLKDQLISLVKETRISHAQLFLSPPGTHAFALAIAYAQFLCCENRSVQDSCVTCPSC